MHGRRPSQVLLMARKNHHTKYIAISAVLSALCCVILSLGTVFESLDLTFATLAALIVWITLLEFGKKTSWSIYLVTSVISVFLLPSKFPALFFAFVTGWYPMFKLGVSRKIKNKTFLFLVKTLCFNAVCLLLIFGIEFFGAALGIVFDEEMSDGWLVTMLVLCNVAFFVTDILMDKLVVIYIYKLRDKLVKLKIVDKKN